MMFISQPESELSVAYVAPFPQTQMGKYALKEKRTFDLLFSLFVTLTVLSWLIPGLCLLICLTSTGPPFYIQRRIGHRGRQFPCLKLRTMYHARGQAFKQAEKNDPRITPLGDFLRRTNLDEMPQFLNVLVGHMSIVGPRPHAVDHDLPYWEKVQNYQFRYTIRPGITGLAQVSGSRGDTSTDYKIKHRLRYDLFYMRRQSLKMDCWICWTTCRQMLRLN